LEKVAVIGAGTMGNGIAQVVAQAGFEVILRDVDSTYLERGLKNINKNLKRSVDKGRIKEGEKEEILSRISLTTTLDLIADTDIVIEAINENMELKKNIIIELDEVCKYDCIFASNTSALSITELATVSRNPERLIGIHFFNPVPVMKLVELIKSITSSQDTFDRAREFVNKLGKTPVEINEAPGFVVNRLLIPMINEAVYILSEGVANAEDIDIAMKLGANHPIGPLALADLIGLDVCLAIMETLYEEFSDSKYRPCPLLRKKVRAGHLGRKTGEGFFNY
jgi:3-hydroxybutyryl-CoA dehydrogenase